VHVRASPVNPADLAPGRGAEAGSNLVVDARKSDGEKDALSFLSIDGHGQTSATTDSVAGGDFIGEVLKVGAGVKALGRGRLGASAPPGRRRVAFVVLREEKALRKIPKDLMPLEHAAMLREYCVAYRLLEDAGDVLKPGDAVIVGRCVRCHRRRGRATLRFTALKSRRRRPAERNERHNRAYETFLASISCRRPSDVRGDDRDAAPTPFSQNTSSKTTSSSCSASFLKTAARLKALGAAEVLVDEGDARAALERRRFFARPKLALDCVGGASAARVWRTVYKIPACWWFSDACPATP
jgi:trans-2-enoyl-CoA reductase